MTSNILELKNAWIYQNEIQILADVNVSLQEGEFVFLIGKTGSGKSSFMKTLYGDIPLAEGSGWVVDYNLRALRDVDIPYMRRSLGIVFQDFKLLPDRTIYDNLLFVLKATGWIDKKQIQERINRVLERVGMTHSYYKYPHQISGGEQQRVAISRALLNDPELILADEPTGNLDPQTSVEVMNLLLDINDSGRTILMATHNYSIMSKFPSRTLCCEDGGVYEVTQNEFLQ